MEDEVLGATPTEVETEETSSHSEDTSDLAKKFEDQRKRAEKAEAEAKELRLKLEQNKKTVNESLKPTDISKDEIKLYAQGLDDEAIDALKIYSKQLNVSLSEAKESDVYKAWASAREARIRSQQAALGASSSSGSTNKKVDFTTRGLTKEQHKELWKKSVGR